LETRDGFDLVRAESDRAHSHVRPLRLEKQMRDNGANFCRSP
jgi:hypothetical protein